MFRQQVFHSRNRLPKLENLFSRLLSQYKDQATTGRKRHYDTRHAPNSKDRPLNDTELKSAKIAGKEHGRIINKRAARTSEVYDQLKQLLQK